MRLIGLLSWYQERESWLAACIASYAQAGITHLVAVDGAYALFPEGTARSRSNQADAILETSNALGLHLTLLRPDQVWAGNEVEKRTALFRHAELLAQPNVDWYCVIDADELVTVALDGWQHQLATTPLHVADVLMHETENRDTLTQAQVDRHQVIDPHGSRALRKLYRAQPGIHVEGSHDNYVTGDGTKLWAHSKLPALDLTNQFEIEHRTNYRTRHRHAASHAYYDTRDALKAEG